MRLQIKKTKVTMLALGLSLMLLTAVHGAPLDLSGFIAEDGVTVPGGGNHLH